MSNRNSRNLFSPGAVARSVALAVTLSLSLGGPAHAGLPRYQQKAAAVKAKASTAVPKNGPVRERVKKADVSLSSIQQKVESVRSRVSVLPDDGPVRDLFKKADAAVVGQLMDVVGQSKEVLDTLQAKRAGFDQYKNGGGADRMRRDLKSLFQDLRTLSDASQAMRCFQDPETSLVPMQVQFMSRAVDRMPPIALFGMQKVLDEGAPEWRTVISDLLADLPVDAIVSMCGTGADVIERIEAARCNVTREMNPTRLARIELKARATQKLFTMIQKFAPEDVQFTLQIVAVGGGGGGTNVTLPIRGILQAIINVLDKVEHGSAKIQAVQQSCEAADEKMERDLLSCTALASYDAQLERVRDLALRRMDSLDASNSDYNAAATAASFGQLCTSYQDFRLQ